MLFILGFFMCRRAYRLGLALLLSLAPSVLWAGPAYCPAALAQVAENPLSDRAGTLVRQLYAELGCALDLIEYPGRRGIRAFNRGQVDGEVMRVAEVEPLYLRAFVRSEIPLFQMQLGLCSHPKVPYGPGAILGYTRGVVWQELHIQALGSFNRYRAFDSDPDLFRAYSNGEIAHFLCETQVIRLVQFPVSNRPAPVVSQQLGYLPLYHYLDRRYSDFMRDFSARLVQENPFVPLN